MVEILQREVLYLFYYLSVQIWQIAPYWALGIVIGSLVSVFGKGKINSLFLNLQNKHIGILGLIPASLLGIASPLCMYGTIPIVAAFYQKGMRQDWLAAFMMSSMLLNPQLLMYSTALGHQIFLLRFILCFLGGIAAGLAIKFFFNEKPFFSFGKIYETTNRDVHPNHLIRLLKNIWRNIKATGPYFLIGIGITALYQRYVPQDLVAHIFGTQNKGFGVLIAATLGVPLYVCGGGTIPLLLTWLDHGMSQGSAVAFMLSGPATKITNLSALKSIFSLRHFIFYLVFVILFALISGIVVDLIFK